MKKLSIGLGIFTALVIGVAVLAGGNGAEETPKGNPAVYKQIEQTTDCVELQNEFEIALRNGNRNRNNGEVELAQIATHYMSAINDRMRKLGCYK